MATLHRLNIDKRRKMIIDLLRRNGRVRVTELSAMMNTSPVTIRNDLSALEREGLLERIQGGAIQTVNNLYQHNAVLRSHDKLEIKKGISRAAASLVNDGETLMINSGSTTLLTAIELLKKKSLNIVTNSLHVALEFGTQPSCRVILLGGGINTQYTFTYGQDAQDQLSKYKADKAILSISGIHPEIGLTTYHAEEAAIDCMMMDRARETLIVADSSKYGHESFAHIAEMRRVHCWVTDRGLAQDQIDKVETYGVRVVTSE